ncbi:TIGR02647 family protein [Kaarinaea lacus]
MSYSPENLAEIDVLMLFDLSNSLEGIKIHKTAKPAAIAAAQRLFEGGFITQVDGGYLTPLGREAAEHAQFLFTMLNANPEE